MSKNLAQQQSRGGRALLFLSLAAIVSMGAWAQSPASGGGATEAIQANSQFIEVIRQLQTSNPTPNGETIRRQLERASCQLSLPLIGSTKLTIQEIRYRAQQAHLRVGWVYQCTKCDEWHDSLAGGYALTTNGAIATCYHVVNPPRDFRTGALVAMDSEGRVLPVTEALAANRYADACIVQVKGQHFTPLPLNTNTSVGDSVYCFSNPQGQTESFTQGIVRRFLRLPERRMDKIRGAPIFVPLRIQVSATWELGHSGSPLLDQCGNAIGQASTVTLENGITADSEATPTSQVFHEATSARDLLSLVRPVK